MKIFNTVQELWSYCRFCPSCQDLTRNIHVTVGPDDCFILNNFVKKDQFLHLNCTFRSLGLKYNTNYIINCLNNSFEAIIGEPVNDRKKMTKAKRSNFYFYIQSNCEKCHDTYTHGSDVELNLSEKIVYNIAVEQEGMYIRSKKDNYHFFFDYQANRLEITPFNNYDICGKPIIFPIFDFDFSKPDKLINRIKTLIVFS